MAEASLEIPLTGVPFSQQEYERRENAVLEAMEAEGLDGLAVTATSHLEYLTGYDGEGAYFAPFPLLLVPGRTPTYVVRLFDEDAVRCQSRITDVATYTQEGDLPAAWASVLRDLGLVRGRLGLELGAWNLAPRDVSELQAELPDLQIVDATRVVARVAAIKSDAEIDVMRRAMGLAQVAIETFQANIVEGRAEIEAAHAIDEAVARAGGSTRDYTLLFGPRTSLPHGTPGPYRLERDQPAFIEVAGWLHGYAAGLARSAVLGQHGEAEALYDLAEDALLAAIDTIRPGITAGEVDAACRGIMMAAGRAEAFRHRTGYQIGILWADRGNLSLEPGAPDVLEPGMTLHMPIILYERGRYGIGVSETVLVSDHGAEVLSDLPRDIHRVDLVR